MNKKRTIEVVMLDFKSPLQPNERLYQLKIRWPQGGATFTDNNGGNGYQLHNAQAVLLAMVSVIKPENLD